LVDFRGEQMALTRATCILLGLEYNIAPTPHWAYDGRLLSEIYDETFERSES